MPDSYYPPRFYVHASNIHFQKPDDIYGPYTGTPVLTYENLRADDLENFPDTLFMFVDPQDVLDGNPHDYESWVGEDSVKRYFGWRRAEYVDSGEYGYIELVGPFYTDLAIVVDRDVR